MRHARHVLAFGSAALLAATTFSLGTSQQGAPRPAAEPVPGTEPDPAPTSSEMPWLRVELGQRAASHPALGSFQMEAHEIWKPVCTNAGGSLTTQQLATYVQRHKALSAQFGRSVIVNSGPAGGGTPWDPFRQSLVPGLRVYDAEGRPLMRTSPSTNGGDERLEITVRLAAEPAQPQNDRPGPPARLVWDIPTESRDLTATFEFTDLPMP